MNETTPVILILGGGVAGMAAARFLERQNLKIVLVEKDSSLGGHAAKWACMATDTCANCGACLSVDMARQVARQKNIDLCLNDEIKTLAGKDGDFDIELASGRTFKARKIILATGFSPFDPAGLFSLKARNYANVITTAQLNTLIRQEDLGARLTGKTSPKIAFIQCVGSRNPKLGKDYCSQVCCKISMRHAAKLTDLIPDARITLFYMDLQIIGKETRTLARELAGKIDLVQGVPAEILKNPETGRLSMITEDSETGTRIKNEFDLVVLSVGMTPSEGAEPTWEALGVRPNPWGFFNTPEACLEKGIHVAGCAQGPKDILESRQQGVLAGAQILKELGMAPDPKITLAVTGSGPQAGAVAQAAADQGYHVVCFGDPQGLAHDRIQKLGGAKILAVEGTAGNFNIVVREAQKVKTMVCGAIIAANEPLSQSGRHHEGLGQALDLDDFARLTPDRLPEQTVIVLDYFGPEFKAEAAKALDAAMTAAEHKKQVFILMNKILVHSPQGQRRYDRARKMGIRFLRYQDPRDLTLSPRENGFRVKVREATLPGRELDLGDLCLVMPASVKAAPGFEALAGLLKDQIDREGFLQSANVRHRISQSPRKGIFYCGACHDESDPMDLETQISEVLSTILIMDFPSAAKDSGVFINEKKCAKCLTCYRICPHRAIILNEKTRPQIMPEACFSCHLCMSNCPALAIESDNYANAQVTEMISPFKTGKKPTVVLACERSAALAAAPLDLPDHICLIPVPCACRISPALILAALTRGADRVVVSGCHEENCRSLEGTAAARLGVEQVLKIPGIPSDKASWEPVAANETQKFFGIISNA